jgi:hypothetical protein
LGVLQGLEHAAPEDRRPVHERHPQRFLAAWRGWLKSEKPMSRALQQLRKYAPEPNAGDLED